MRVASLLQMFVVQVAALVAELPRVGHRTHSQRSRPWCAACVSAPALGRPAAGVENKPVWHVFCQHVH